MESSALIAFRALIMLACLVLVPLAAIFGSAFPEVVKTNLVERFWPAHKQIAQNTSADAPPFGDTTHSAAPEAAPIWPPQAPASPGAVRAVGTAQPSDAIRATPAQFSAPAESSTATWPPTTDRLAPPAEPKYEAATSQQPAALAAPKARLASGNPLASRQRLTPARDAETSSHESPGARAVQNPEMAAEAPSAYLNRGQAEPSSPASARPAGTQAADFKATERRLRQYGASYYRLETVGRDGLEYRFHCSMPTAGNPQNPRHFEATDCDPLTAMTRVADEIQAWVARQ